MLLSILLSLSPNAEAAGYYFLDTGTRGMARGGAFVAGVDDLSAQYYNPAGLMNLDRPQAYVNTSLVGQNVSFTRMDIDDDGNVITTYDPVENIAPMMFIPAFGVSHNFGLKRANFALGFYPPFAPDMEYPADGAQRYTLVDSLVWQTYAGPSVAVQPLPWISVGAGLVWTLFRAEEALSINVCNPLVDEKTGCGTGEYDGDQVDLDFALSMMDPFRVTGNFGVLIEPHDKISIGASLQPPIDVNGKGSLTADFAEDHWLSQYLAETHLEDDEVSVQVTMPMVVRMGVEVRPNQNLAIEAATVLQRWCQTTEILVTDINLMLETVAIGTSDAMQVPITDDVILPADYDDSWSFRLGGDYDINDRFTVRSGVHYEMGAVPPATQSVAVVDADKWGAALGGSGQIGKRMILDVGFAKSWLQSREIRDSEITQLIIPVDVSAALTGGSLEAPIQDGDPVGNGDFSSNVTFASVGMTVFFGSGT